MKTAKFFDNDKDAPKPNKPNHIGVAVIICNNDGILFEKRSDSNLWSLIGGGLKINEDLVDCAIRETFEETGIKIDRIKLNFYKIYDNPNRIASYPDGNVLRIITVAYTCKLDVLSDLKLSSESEDLKFINIADLHKYNIAKTHLSIIKDYLKSE